MLLPLVASALMRDLWAPDEPRYAEVAREAYGQGGLLVMHLCDAIYPDKPPLVYWLSGLFGSLFGWHEFWLRVPSLLATAGTAWCVALLARRWWGEAEARWAPALFLTTAMATEIGARLQLDPVLTFLCTAGLLVLDSEARDVTQRRRQVWLAGALVGLAALAKGPVAFVHVGLPWALWLRFSKRASSSEATRPSAGKAVGWGAALLALAIPLTWALSASLAEPALFEELFYGQHVGRVARGTQHGGPFWKHLTRLPLLLLPWTPIVIMGVRLAWTRRMDAGLVKAGLWFGVLLGFFSAIGPKRDLYLLPAYPALALLGSRAWCLVVTERARAHRVQLWTAVLLFAVLGAALVAAPHFVEIPAMIEGAAWRGGLTGGVFLFGALWMFAGRAGNSVWGARLLWSWCAAATVLALVIFPAINPIKSGRTLAAVIAARPEKPSVIPCVGVQPEAYRFYAGVPTVRGGLQEARDAGGPFLGLIRIDNWEAMGAESQARFEILYRRQVGGREVLLLGVGS